MHPHLHCPLQKQKIIAIPIITQQDTILLNNIHFNSNKTIPTFTSTR